MPRRNLFLLLVVGIVALVCYKKVQTNQYGQILSESLTLINRFSLEKVDSEKLFEGAMDGMVDQLDEYSYIPPKN
jgi:C-terminal processing protease CtpA/Prc